MAIRISQLSKRSGVSPQTLRYYEREKLLPSPPRLASGYRSYPDDAVRRVHFIKRAQEIGFSLAEIRELLSIRLDAKGDSSSVHAIASAKILDIEQKIVTLLRMKESLKRISSLCPACGPASECPILECLESTEFLP